MQGSGSCKYLKPPISGDSRDKSIEIGIIVSVLFVAVAVIISSFVWWRCTRNWKYIGHGVRVKISFVIGEGAFSVVKEGVYKDQDRNEHHVAVKFLKRLQGPEHPLGPLRNELDVLNTIPEHPNIVKLYFVHFGGGEREEIGSDKSFIVEELMHTNLSKLIHGDSNESGPIMNPTYGSMLRVFQDIVAGLQVLHMMQVVHYDLKPENILLDHQLTAKIADFGCSKLRAHSYMTAMFAGTLAYMAPEVYMAGVYADFATLHVDALKIDIFSLGVVMWECLSGRNPRGEGITGRLCTRDSSSSRSGATSSSPSRASSSRLTDNDSMGATTAARGNLPSDLSELLKNVRYPLDERHPEELRSLVHKCQSFEFTDRPSCEEVAKCLTAMSVSDWIDKPLPWNRIYDS